MLCLNHCDQVNPLPGPTASQNPLHREQMFSPRINYSPLPPGKIFSVPMQWLQQFPTLQMFWGKVCPSSKLMQAMCHLQTKNCLADAWVDVKRSPWDSDCVIVLGTLFPPHDLNGVNMLKIKIIRKVYPVHLNVKLNWRCKDQFNNQVHLLANAPYGFQTDSELNTKQMLHIIAAKYYRRCREVLTYFPRLTGYVVKWGLRNYYWNHTAKNEEMSYETIT